MNEISNLCCLPDLRGVRVEIKKKENYEYYFITGRKDYFCGKRKS
jgi:hypothetical protein